MTADELDAWLETDESRRVGQKKEPGGESVGHAAGRRIAAFLRGHSAPGDEDYRLMRKTVGVIRRHVAQAPDNIVTSRWRYSLMNWGHDPLK